MKRRKLLSELAGLSISIATLLVNVLGLYELNKVFYAFFGVPQLKYGQILLTVLAMALTLRPILQPKKFIDRKEIYVYTLENRLTLLVSSIISVLLWYFIKSIFMA